MQKKLNLFQSKEVRISFNFSNKGTEESCPIFMFFIAPFLIRQRGWKTLKLDKNQGRLSGKERR
jgi:hypothetical protein